MIVTVRKFLISIAFIVSLLGALEMQNVNASTSTQSFQVVATSIPIYDIRHDEIIGYLRQGEIYHYLYKDNDYFYIQIENANGRVVNDETRAKDVSSQNIKNTYYVSDLPASNGQIATTQLINVYNVNGRTIGQIPKDRRMNYYGKDKYRYVIYIGNVQAYVNAKDVVIDRGIAIITYHALEDVLATENINKSTYVSTAQFKRNMDYLKHNGYETISLQELELYLNKKMNLSKKTVVITFDDGIAASMKLAYPILQANKQVATQFVITSRASHRDYVNEALIAEYGDVFYFEGHTYDLHNMLKDEKGRDYAQLTTQTLEQIRADLAKSRELLPNQKYFAYPFGKTSDYALTALKAEGFTMAFTVTEGYVVPTVDKFLIPRFSVYQRTTDNQFAAIVKGTPVLKKIINSKKQR